MTPVVLPPRGRAPLPATPSTTRLPRIAFPVWHWLAEALGEVPSGLAGALGAETFQEALQVARDARAVFPFAALLPLMIARQLPSPRTRHLLYDTLADGDLLALCASSMRRYRRDLCGSAEAAGVAPIPRFYVRGVARCLLECCVLLARQRSVSPLRLQLAASELAEECGELLAAALPADAGAVTLSTAVDALYFWLEARDATTLHANALLQAQLVRHCGLTPAATTAGDGGGSLPNAVLGLPDVAFARLVAVAARHPATPAQVRALADAAADRLGQRGHTAFLPPAGATAAAAAAAAAAAVPGAPPAPRRPWETGDDALQRVAGVEALGVLCTALARAGVPSDHGVWRAAARCLAAHPAAIAVSSLAHQEALLAVFTRQAALPADIRTLVGSAWAAGAGLAAPASSPPPPPPPLASTPTPPSAMSTTPAPPPPAATGRRKADDTGEGDGGDGVADAGDAVAAARLLHAAAGGDGAVSVAGVTQWLSRVRALLGAFPRLDRGEQLMALHTVLQVAATTVAATRRLGIVDTRLCRVLDAALPTALQALREHPLLPADAVSVFGGLLRGLAPFPAAADALAATTAALAREASTSALWHAAPTDELVTWVGCMVAGDAVNDALTVRLLRVMDGALPQLPAAAMAHLLYALYVGGGLARGKCAHTTRFLLRSLAGTAARGGGAGVVLDGITRAALTEACVAVLHLPVVVPPPTTTPASVHDAPGGGAGGAGGGSGGVHASLRSAPVLADATALRAALLAAARHPTDDMANTAVGLADVVLPAPGGGDGRTVTLRLPPAAAFMPQPVSTLRRLPLATTGRDAPTLFAAPPLAPATALLTAAAAAPPAAGLTALASALPPLPPALLPREVHVPPVRVRLHLLSTLGWTPRVIDDR